MSKIVKYAVLKSKIYARMIINPKSIVLAGVKIDLNDPIITPSIKQFMYSESYEGGEIEILKNTLSASDIVMEIGAGIGFLSSYIAKRIGSGRVVAYEANPALIQSIQNTYMINNVSPIIKNAILSDSSGVVDFFIEKNYWSSSLIRRSEDAEKVIINKLDINQELLIMDFSYLIMDIEGGEQYLIPEIKSFKNIRKILIDLHPHVIGNKNVSNVIQKILEAGFSLDISKCRGDVFYFEKNIDL